MRTWEDRVGDVTPDTLAAQIFDTWYGHLEIDCVHPVFEPQGGEINEKMRSEKFHVSYVIDMYIWMFPKIVVPPNHPILIGFSMVFHYKPSILGYHFFWKHPYVYIYPPGWGKRKSSTQKWDFGRGYVMISRRVYRLFSNRLARRDAI